MSNIKLDTNKLNEKITELKSRRDEIKEIFENIEAKANTIPDFWQSATSENVLNEFKSIYDEFKAIKESNDKYIDFLEKIVIEDYKSKEDSLGKLIDSNI